MSTIVKVAEEEEDFGENPLEVSWKNRGKSFKSPSRRYDTAENIRTIPKSNPIRPIQNTQWREVFVERGNHYKDKTYKTFSYRTTARRNPNLIIWVHTSSSLFAL